MRPMRFAIDRDFTVRTLADLVRINSINPSLEPGGPGEAEIAAYLARTLMRLGLTVDRHEPVPAVLHAANDGTAVSGCCRKARS